MTLSTFAQRYYPGAIQMPGPVGNVYPQQNAVEGVVCHSADGNWSDAYTPMDTMIQRGVSFPFTVFKSGVVWQHYPLDASCWHAGGMEWNTRLVGIEHEGEATEPLTEAQIVASVALVRWIAHTAGWPALTRGVTLREHNELYVTACPSGRIPWHRYTLPAVPTPLPGGEFLPEPDLADVAKFWAAVAGGNVSPDVEITPVKAKRAGWEAYLVEVKQ